MPTPKLGTSKDPKDADNVLKAFIAHDPTARYSFDSERDSPYSEICRQPSSRDKECIIVQMNSKRLFEAMQAHGFFCALPMDPGQTHIECRTIPK